MTRRRRKRPLFDGWSCPRCGQTGRRHGRGGVRGCKAKLGGPNCPGLRCQCKDGECYDGGWRRSPCQHAVCAHCGWEGMVSSRLFERAFGGARCVKTIDGWHWCSIRVVPNEVPGMLQLEILCEACGSHGTLTVDPVREIVWRPKENDHADH